MPVNLSDPNWILAICGVGGAVLGLVVWLVRLEGKVARANDDIDRIEKEVKEDITRVEAAFKQSAEKTETNFIKLFEKLSTMEISLARLEGKLSNETLKKS